MLTAILILWPMAAAIIGFCLGRRSEKARDILADIATIAECVLMIALLVRSLQGGSDLYLGLPGLCGMGLNLTLDGFRCVYGTVASLMWATTSVFSRQYFTYYANRNRYYLFNLLTLGATMGVFLAADLFTAFVFFEIMSFTSFVWVAHDETGSAMKAACTYLAVAIIGGLFTLMGLFMLYNMTGTLTLSEIPEKIAEIRQVWPRPFVTVYGGIVTPTRLYLTGALVTCGFAAKAGVWPLHIWLPKAHPVAPAPASALLSGILTKSGIFGVLAVTCNMFAGDTAWGRAIMWLGVITMFTGALLALFSINLKRTLACSSMSQIGFIMTGIGAYALSQPGSESAVLAARGTVLYMVNHSLIKLVLFMIAGVVYMNIHKLELGDIRGYGRRKPLLAVCFAIGALSISGIPGSSGYIAKTLLHEAIVESGAGQVIEWLFLLCGGMTLCYMLKLFITVFVEKNHDDELQKHYDDQKDYWNTESSIAVAVPAVILAVMGLFPYLIMNRVAYMSSPFLGITHDAMGECVVVYYALYNLTGSLISIAIGLVLFFLIFRRLDRNVWPEWLDLEDRIYRPLILKILPGILGFVSAITGQITDEAIILLRRTTHRQISTRVPTGSMDDHLAVETGVILDHLLPHRDGTSHIPELVEKEERAARTQRVIDGSLSFGLILVCIGLILVLIYTLASA